MLNRAVCWSCVKIDSSLSFNTHINSIVAKAKLRANHIIRCFLSKDCRQVLGTLLVQRWRGSSGNVRLSNLLISSCQVIYMVQKTHVPNALCMCWWWLSDNLVKSEKWEMLQTNTLTYFDLKLLRRRRCPRPALRQPLLRTVFLHFTLSFARRDAWWIVRFSSSQSSVMLSSHLFFGLPLGRRQCVYPCIKIFGYLSFSTRVTCPK